MALLFTICNWAVLPFWALMIFAPRWLWTERILRPTWVLLPLPLLYAVLVIPALPAVLPLLANPQLAGVRELLATEEGATVAWVHFLAFDLFVGRWIYLRSLDGRRNPWLIRVFLFFTLMVGPLGLLLYLAAGGWRDGSAGKSAQVTSG